MRCVNCRADNPEGMKFCGQCGSPLRAEAAGAAAELRQLTVLFCDLVGSTSLAESLDPEELREVTAAYHTACEGVIRKHDGHIAQYLGDGILVYFGYPVAHEDDARRAVRTALGIVRSLSAVNAKLQKDRGISLSARLGIHTGPVVVGEVGGGERRENLALGKTPNLAARIQNIAAPGTVVVSDDTYRIVDGFFECVPLGVREIKGLSEVVALHQVLRESDADSRLDVARRTGLTQLTGRDEEVALLDERWRGVSAGGAHAVLVQGEAGIGKSRIVDSLRERVKGESATVLECFCSPYAQTTPLLPVVTLIERALAFTSETTDTDKRAALDARLVRSGIHTDETFALMAQLLAIPLAGADPVATYSPQKRRERTLETILAWLLSAAHDGPVLWVVEDLHWADPTTLEFVSSVLGADLAEPLLVVLTFRPDFAAPWHANGRVSSVALDRLAASETSSMAARVAHGKKIPDEVLSQIVARTEGVPLFVEEITKAVLELGVLVEREDRYELAGPLPPDLIPSTVQGSLNARLDRLGSAKAIAQVAATIGREFRYDLLRAVAATDDVDLRAGLDRLVTAELVYPIGAPQEETYLFKHALIQDTAYQSLLKKARRELHQRIAEALASRFQETAKNRPELVAEHFSRAERVDEALKYWLLGGQSALGRAANHEAIAHLNRGLALLSEFPAARQLEQELEFLIALVPALIAAQGWASEELGRVYRRAGELVDLLGETPHRFIVMAGLMGYHHVAGRIVQGLAVAKQVLALATKIGDPLLITIGRQDCCAAHCYHGDYQLAMEHGDAALAMLDVERERVIARMIGLSSCVGITAYEVVALWMLGYPARSLQAGVRGVTLARELGHPPSIAFSLASKSATHLLQGDAPRTIAMADEGLRVAREERLGFWEPMISIFRASAVSLRGDFVEGATALRGALQRYHAAGNGAQQIWFLAALADAQWKAGEWIDAFATLAKGKALAKAHGEGMFEPDLYRLEGEFLFAQATGAGGPASSKRDRPHQLASAERFIRDALGRARQQEARMLELRSLMSLCRVRREQGDVSKEREELAAVFGAFTEGLEIPDLVAARALLESLST